MRHRAHLRVIDGNGELLEDACAGCLELSKRVAVLARENTRLKNQEEERQASSIGAKQIREVLDYWRPLCMPKAKIVVGSERWQKVKQRLADRTVEGDLAYTVLHLKAAVVGAKMSDFHAGHGYLDAATIFRDSTTVDKHLARVTAFKREVGTSALEVVDELMGPGLAWLAARCDCCGRTKLEHLMPRDGLFDAGCPGFEDFHWGVQVRLAELERERMDAA